MWVVGSRGDNNVKQVHRVILNVNLSFNPFWKFEFARNATAWFDQSLTILDDTWRYLAILDDTWLVSLLAFFYFLSFSARRQSRSQESRLPVVCFPRLLNLGIRSHKLTACPDGSVLIWFLRCHWLGILIECIPVSIMESRLNPKKESRSWETIIEHLCAGARRWSWRRVLDLHNQEEGRPPHWAEEDCQQTARL